jgi:hypothetical protein
VLRRFENWELRNVLPSRREVVTGGWKKLHNEEPHDIYPSSFSISRNKKQEWEMVRTWGIRGGGVAKKCIQA